MTIKTNGREVIRTLALADSIARDHGHETLTLEHMLAALVRQPDVQACLAALDVPLASVEETLEAFFDGGYLEATGRDPVATEAYRTVIARSVGIQLFAPCPLMPIDLLVHLLQWPHEDSHAVTLLMALGLSALTVKRYLAQGAAVHAGLAGMTDVAVADVAVAGGGVAGDGGQGIASRAEADAYLAKFGLFLNTQARDNRIDPLIGREAEMLDIVKIVSRRTKNNVVLVGEPGVGKTAIAEGLALRIVRGEVPDAVKDSVVYALDVGALVAGTRFRGDVEERTRTILAALGFIDRAILVIDEIHTIMGAGGSQGSMDVANLLKPALAKGGLRCIGSTTAEEFRRHFEKDRALLRRFKRLDVGEPSIADAKRILHGLKSSYEDHHKVTYTDAALAAAVELTARYVPNALLPDKAIDIIDSAGARQRIAPAEARLGVVGVAQIEDEVSKVARIPAQAVRDDESSRLERLNDDLNASVFGQEPALRALTDAVFVSRAGLRGPNRPACVFLFTGPTGVGKTEAAKTLAGTLGVGLLRYDMSEYMEKHSGAKLIGAPPGYVGYGEGGAGGGLLVNAVDSQPHSVLLLDEFEKAHPDIQNLFLQVFDNGTLTSATGKTVSFRNVIVILTSNAGAAELAKPAVGFTRDRREGADTEAVERLFTPEFRNRLDAVVPFAPLSPDNMLRIVDSFIAQLAALARDRNVALEVDAGARRWLAAKGHDPAMGARPLARLIHERIKTPLSRLMLIGPLKTGGHVLFSVDGTGVPTATVSQPENS